MLQLIQNLKTGQTTLEEVPAPKAGRGKVLIQTTRSLVSLGTERMLVEFGKASLLEKARQQPEKVKMVLDKVKTDGLMPTVEAVFNKLEQPLPLGYCNVGRVVAVGEGVSGIQAGDRVASNGPHAEFVNIPANLVAKVPEDVSDDEAAFTVIGSIGLQGIRLLNPTFGETVVVTGLGLIGLLTAELLKASGCRVIGIDLDEQKIKLAQTKGILAVNPAKGTDPVQYVLDATQGRGADGVIITASAKTDEIVSQAARMSRKRGRIILVGVVGLQLNRSEFYEKELTFQVSCSYGPGRYDEQYEQKGIDYPYPFVRWTEQRNFQAVLQAIAEGQLDVKPLISRVVPLQDYREIYDNISESDSIASLLAYPEDARHETQVTYRATNFKGRKGVTGIIGAGNFTKMTMLPALKSHADSIKYIVSAGGVSGSFLAKRYNIPHCTTDYKVLLQDPGVDLVMITTRHDSHARMTIEALKVGKHVFVEKPLALNREELANISQQLAVQSPQSSNHNHNDGTDAYSLTNGPENGKPSNESRRGEQQIYPFGTTNSSLRDNEFISPGQPSEQQRTTNNEQRTTPPPTLTVGYNRRFSPHAIKMKELLGHAGEPIHVVATMNAGHIPPEVWVHDMETGGGRIIGEACHLIDLITYLTGSRVKAVCMNALGTSPAINSDNATILLQYENGANGVVNYFSNGSKAYSKERVEVYSAGRTLVMDNFRMTQGYGFKGFNKLKTKLDKGHQHQFSLLMDRIKTGGPALIPFEELINTSLASFAAIESMQKGRWIMVNE